MIAYRIWTILTIIFSLRMFAVSIVENSYLAFLPASIIVCLIWLDGYLIQEVNKYCTIFYDYIKTLEEE